MAVYATKEQLAVYLSCAIEDLPEQADKMLRDASALIDAQTLNRAAAYTGENVRDAVCAQVEYWEEIDPSTDVTGAPEAIKIGTFSMEGKFAELAPRARRLLLAAGLLYRGVSSR